MLLCSANSGGCFGVPTYSLLPSPVADRDKTDADADIDFDFFEDLPTVEKSAPEPKQPKRGGGGSQPPKPPKEPRRPKGTGGTRGSGAPLLRLAALIVAAIAIAVVLVLWVNSCRGNSAKDAYASYMKDVSGVTQESASVGKSLTTLLTTPGVTLDQIDSKLGGLAKQQQQVVQRAQDLQPPGPLSDEQQSLVDAMQLRASGLTGLQGAFAQVQPASDKDEAGTLLAEQAKRLLAADVVYEDLFKARSQEVMKQQGITGVAVPEAPFLGDGDLATQSSLSEIVNRINSGGTGSTTDSGDTSTGLHGNQLVSTQWQPNGETLSPDNENTIIVTDDLSFQVIVRNSGDFQETQVKVTLTILLPDPIKQVQTIDLIDPGQTKTATFTGFNGINDFAEVVTLKTTVEPVPGEQKTENNTVEYPVIFSIG